MTLQETLDAYFTGRDVKPEEMEQVIRYRDECIQHASRPTLTDPKAGFAWNFKTIADEYPELLKKHLPGQRVIELGPGATPLAKQLFEKYNIAEYVGVELFHPNLTEENLGTNGERVMVKKEDSLTYLLQQTDESSIVISFGFMSPELLSAGTHRTDYYRFLGREIYRVTPAGSISIHLGTQIISDYRPDLFFVEHGFNLVDSLYGVVWNKE